MSPALQEIREASMNATDDVVRAFRETVGLTCARGRPHHLPRMVTDERMPGTIRTGPLLPPGAAPAVVMDMAPTVAGLGRVGLKAARGEPMPAGWMIDHEG